MLEMVGYEDSAGYDDIDENNLGEGDVNAFDRCTWEGGQPPHGVVHKIYHDVEYCGKERSDA